MASRAQVPSRQSTLRPLQVPSTPLKAALELRPRYENSIIQYGLRTALRTAPISTYRDVFTPATRNKLDGAYNSGMLHQNCAFATFVNKSQEYQSKRRDRSVEDLRYFQQADLHLHLSLLIDTTAALYRKRAELQQELSSSILQCQNYTDWSKVNPHQRSYEVSILRTAHLNRSHVSYLCSPTEWCEKYKGYQYPREINITTFDLVKAKSWCVLGAEDREFLIWHTDELHRVNTIFKEDIARLQRPSPSTDTVSKG